MIYVRNVGEQSDPSNGVLTKSAFAMIENNSRIVQNPINTVFENNSVYFGLENDNEGCFSPVTQQLYYQGTFTPPAPTDAEKYSYTVAQGVIFRNNSYYKRSVNTNGKNFIAWANGTIQRKTLAEQQALGYEVGSTITTVNF